MGGDDSQAAPVGIGEARLGRHVDEPAAVVAKDVIGQATGNRAACSRVAGRVRMRGTAWGCSGRRREVVADVEIQVAIAVEVGERRRGRPVAIAAQARLCR